MFKPKKKAEPELIVADVIKWSKALPEPYKMGPYEMGVGLESELFLPGDCESKLNIGDVYECLPHGKFCVIGKRNDFGGTVYTLHPISLYGQLEAPEWRTRDV